MQNGKWNDDIYEEDDLEGKGMELGLEGEIVSIITHLM